jgi:aspartate ammonia-lyase
MVKDAIDSGKSIRHVIAESGLLTEEQIRALFDLRRWTIPGLLKAEPDPPGKKE